MCSFFFWTATSSGDPIVVGPPQTDYYNQLTNGFLDGELSIPTLPPKGLLDLPNPYDPAQNAYYQGAFHDLSLYHGHLYLSWGPTPVLTLFLPWRLLHVGAMPQNLAVLLYGIIGLGFVLLTYARLIERFVADARLWKVVLGGVALSLGSVVAYLLRRPEVYEVAVSAAYCCASIGLYFLSRVVLSDRPRRRDMALAGVAIALAAGARWDLILLGGLVVAAAAELWRRDWAGGWRRWSARVAWLVVPWGTLLVLLLGYNAARFGSPFEIGSSYQLAGTDPLVTPFYQLGYIVPNLYYYFVAPVRFTLAFPFLAIPPPPAYPGPVPATFEPEIIGSLFATMPICLVLFAAPFTVRRRIEPVLFWSLAALVVVGGAVAFSMAFGVPGSTERYVTDFATLFSLPAVLLWLAWSPPRRALARTVTVVGAVFLCFSALCALAISVVGPNDQLQTGNPATYHALEDLTSPLPTLFTKIVGHADVVRVINPDAEYPADLGDYGTYSSELTTFQIDLQVAEIDIVAPRAGTYVLHEQLTATPQAPTHGVIEVHLETGGRTEQFVFHRGRVASRITLPSGLDRVYVWATITAPQVAGAAPDILDVSDFGLSAAPSAS